MRITDFPGPPGAADEVRTVPAVQKPPNGAPNAGRFDDFDMVVSVPRRVINAQLARLQQRGAIASRPILAQHPTQGGERR